MSSLAGQPRHRSRFFSLRKPEPRDIGELVEEIEKDYQFLFGFLVISSVCQSGTIAIDHEGGSSKILADNLTSSLRSALPSVLRAFSYGRSAFEKVYFYDRANRLFLVDRFEFLPFEYSYLLLTPAGEFAGIRLKVGDRAVKLPARRSWWFALDPTAVEPHGRSRYLGAPQKIFEQRQELERLEDIWYQKFAIGHGVARAPERSEVPPPHDKAQVGELTASEEFLDPLEVLGDQCAQLEAGGTLILSSKHYADGKPLYDYEETAGQPSGEPLEERRRTLDFAALRSLGIPERAVIQAAGAVGSQALARVHFDVLIKTCQGILDQIVASYQEFVVDPAVNLNFPLSDRPTLRLHANIVGAERFEEIMDLVRTVMSRSQVSPIIKQEIVDLAKLLEMVNLPLGSGHREGLARL